MAGSIAKAYVQVIPTTTGIKGNLSSAFGDAGNSSGGAFGANLIGKIKGLIATAGLGQLLKDTIMTGADLEQSLGGIETLFGTGGKSIEEYAASVGKAVEDIRTEYNRLNIAEQDVLNNASNAYKTAGMSANEYMETVTSFSASLISSFSGDTVKAASVADMALTDMSDNANKMGTDMEAIQNAYQGFAKQNYTMLDNLKLGYGGTKTEMQRLLSDAQKLTGIKYDISNLSDVYEAIHVIQTELGITGTTAKEASSTIKGSLLSMKAAFSDVLGNLALGRNIEPSLEALAKTTKTFLIDNLAPAVINIIKALPGAASTFLKEIIPGDVHSVVNETITKFTAYVTANMPKVLDSGIEVLTSLIRGVTQTIPMLSESASEILGMLRTYLTDGGNLKELFFAGGEMLSAIAVGIVNLVGDLATTAIEVLGALGDYLTDPKNMKDLLTKVGKIGAQIATAIWDNLVSVWSSLRKNFPNLMAGLEAGVQFSNTGTINPALIPGHADGLDYVPYDGYIAALHKGEMVLTRKQADAVREGVAPTHGVSITQYIYSEAKSAADLMEEAVYQQEKAVLLGV